MGDFLILERFSWFHQQLQAKRYPNASALAAQFSLSGRIAQRDIEYMHIHLGAPFEYDAGKDGYYYPENNIELPHMHATQEELLAILLARNLLSNSVGGMISRSINSFGKKLFSATGNLGLTEKRMQEVFSATWHSYSPSQADTFEKVTEALLQQKVLVFNYSSPRVKSASERQVEPHHLQHYMGSWVLIAWCRTREAWRKFFLSRMGDPVVLANTFESRPKEEWEHQLEGAFGIFQDTKNIPVTLRFTPERARWIREQVWHPQQNIQELLDGGLELTLPVADFREIKLRILQYGSDVEVVEPTALRREVREEVGRMTALYSNK